MTAVLRVAAIAIALAAIVDPVITVHEAQPVPVDIRALPSPADPNGVSAARVKADLLARLGGALHVTNETPRAVVLIGGAPGHDVPGGVPLSTVSVEPRGRNVRVVDVRATETVLPGQRAVLTVNLEATDAGGLTSAVVVEHDGLEVARVTRAWHSPVERATVTLTYAPIETGLIPLRIRVLPVSGEVSNEDNVADVAVRATRQPLRVLAWEPRPSWSAAFVRRALEADPAFEISSVVRSSRGLDTRSGTPPPVLSAKGLATFDVAIVGAPEELDRRDVDALDAFMNERGGAVVVLPDRAPSGEYRRLLPAVSFDEVLLDRAVPVRTEDGRTFQASEFVLPLSESRTGATLGSIVRSGVERTVVQSWPRGAGVVVMSGALDAWRFRAAADEGFAKFWTTVVASLALQSPPALSVSVEPAFAAPGDPLSIRARYRLTELARDGETTRVPAVSATLVASDGRATPVRLWPSSTAGEFEGTIDAPAAGKYDLRVSGGAAAVADAPVLVAAGARSRQLATAPSWLADVTGGISAHASETRPLDDLLRAMPPSVVSVPVHPMRSPWWILPFAGALCVEWGLRRRKGLR